MAFAQTSPERPAAGIAMLTGGLFLFSLQDIVIKMFAGEYAVLQIVFIRGAVAMLPLLIMVKLAYRGRRVVLRRPGWLLLRGAFGFASYTGYYMAVASLPLAQVVTITFTAPIFATALSALLLREPVGRRRWCAVAIGFVAAVIVIGPQGFGVGVGALMALSAAITYALMTLTTRYLGDQSEAALMSLVSIMVFTVGAGLASIYLAFYWSGVVTSDPSLQFLLRPWRMPEAHHLLLMVALGINAVFGFYYLTKAYCLAPVSVVAPFEYTYIFWAVLFGYFVWGEVPAPSTWLGLALLIGSSLYLLRREMRATAAAPVGDAGRSGLRGRAARAVRGLGLRQRRQS